MVINVIDFYREKDKENTQNPFMYVLNAPSFGIIADIDWKKKELILRLSGNIACPLANDLKDFEIESYQNYIIITDFLLGENGERVRESWGLSKEDFRELFFELYLCLLKKHSHCSLIKKIFLLAIGLWKFSIGRKLK